MPIGHLISSVALKWAEPSPFASTEHPKGTFFQPPLQPDPSCKFLGGFGKKFFPAFSHSCLETDWPYSQNLDPGGARYRPYRIIR